VAFAPSPLRHSESFFTPKTLDLFVIDDPTVGAGVVVSGPESTAGMVLGVLAQPRPQRGVGVLWCCRGGFVALGGAMLPGHAAGEPFTDPQHPLEMTNGRPPAFRA
jgi:hypothetical protein